MADYLATKSDELLINPVWMNLKMMLSKRSQTQKSTMWMVPFVPNVTYCTMTMYVSNYHHA